MPRSIRFCRRTRGARLVETTLRSAKSPDSKRGGLKLNSKQTLVIGIGEVGGALSEVLSDSHPVLRHDLEPINFNAPIGVMHLCIPFRSATEFESAALSYIDRFQPDLTIINGTVLPGTTRRIALASGTAVAFSPV